MKVGDVYFNPVTVIQFNLIVMETSNLFSGPGRRHDHRAFQPNLCFAGEERSAA
jgi:hypothetical protein